MTQTSDSYHSGIERVGFWIAGLFLFLYAITLSPGAFPGESAHYIARGSGIDPFFPLSHPLWMSLAFLLDFVPVATLSVRLNLLSAVFAATALYLLYRIVFLLHEYDPFDAGAHGARKKLPASTRILAGFTSVAVLGTCTPFWITATRAHPYPLDLCLLLGALHLLLSYRRQPTDKTLYALAALYGAGITEFATMIVFLPVFAIVTLWYMWRNGFLTMSRALRALGCFAAGASIYFIFALCYWMHPSFDWSMGSRYGEALWFIWREQYHMIAKSVPKVGWLLVAMMTIVPWLSLLALRRKHPSQRGGSFGGYILSVLLGVIAVAVVFNVPIAPWPLFRFSPLLVTPYIFVALLAAYLIGYIYETFRDESQFDKGIIANGKRLFRRFLLPALCIVMAVAAGLNLREANGRLMAPVRFYEGLYLQSIHNYDWLVSSEPLADNLRIRAKEESRPLVVINAAYRESRPYLNYLGSLFDDSRLKSLAQIGFEPLLHDWLIRDEEIQRKLSIHGMCDLWRANGYDAIPNKLNFIAAKPDEDLDLDALLEEHESFWREFMAYPWDSYEDTVLAGWIRTLQRHVSKVANNLGVLFEDRERPDLARPCYDRAREIYPDNVSALLNAVLLAQKEKLPDAGSLQGEFETLAAELEDRRYEIWSLSYAYGYVRHPEAYVDRGWAWAMSGKPQLAAADIKQAMTLAGINGGESLQFATFLFQQEQDEDSKLAYERVLATSPNNPNAMLGLARIAIRQGELTAARSYLDQLMALGVSPSALRVEELILHAAQGELHEAKDLLEQLLKENPQDQRLLAMMAVIASALGDDVLRNNVVEKIEAEDTSKEISLMLAQLDTSSLDFARARQRLEILTESYPGFERAWESLLRLDVSEGKRDEADIHVRKLLALNPESAYGNLILGSIQLLREQVFLAEASFRASVSADRSPEALNSLAWVLYRKGEYDEALGYAKEAVSINASDGAAWDTLGVVQMALGQLKEATRSLQKALELAPDNPEIILHVAQMYEKRNRTDAALELAENLITQQVAIPPDVYDEARAMMKRLR